MNRFKLLLQGFIVSAMAAPCPAVGSETAPADRTGSLSVDLYAGVRAEEQRRILQIQELTPSVVCIFDPMRTGSGSGVIIDADGFGLTNFHVVESMMDTRRGLAGLSDGRLEPIEILGVDPTGDVAMFRIQGAERVPPVTLGDSDGLAVGDPVLAFGNPFSLADDHTPTVTRGIVSGLHRFQPGVDGRLVYTDCIQVDASINPGNSGGPLFDRNGALIGINGRISIERRGQVNVGLGYAIPINQIKRFIDDLRAGKVCRHGTIGATVADVAPGLPVLDSVRADGPAWTAGLRPGDVVLSIDGVPTGSAHRVANLLGTYPGGWTVRMRVQHAAEEQVAEVRLEPVEKFTSMMSKAPPTGTTVAPNPDPPLRAALPTAESIPRLQKIDRHIVKLYGARAAWQQAYGSAVLITDDGQAVTTLSLLLEGETLRAVRFDGREYPASIIKRDKQTQLALLQLHPAADSSAAFSPARLGTTDPLIAGDWLATASNAFDVASPGEPVSITLGLLGGRIALDARRGNQPYAYTGTALLLDAISSNPGAAGGGVFDLDGELVGLLGKTVTSNLTNTFVNYAIPVEVVRTFLSAESDPGADAADDRVAARPSSRSPAYTGMKMFELGYRQKLVYVERVRRGSPADDAGVKSDDLIVTVNGQRVRDLAEYRRWLADLNAGDTMQVVLKRADRLLELSLVLEPAQ